MSNLVFVPTADGGAQVTDSKTGEQVVIVPQASGGDQVSSHGGNGDLLGRLAQMKAADESVDDYIRRMAWGKK